jgi:hypothetical protein
MSMTTFGSEELGKAQKDRVNQVVRSFEPGRPISLEQLFSSEKVARTVEVEKFVINGFDPYKLLGTLPFTPIIYAPICRTCVKRKHYSQFKTLVKSGLVVPVLTNDYRYYDEDLREFIVTHDHVSRWEFSAYQYLRAASSGESPLCGGCLSDQAKKLFKGITDRKDLRAYKALLDLLMEHLRPFPSSDRH